MFYSNNAGGAALQEMVAGWWVSDRRHLCPQRRNGRLLQLVDLNCPQAPADIQFNREPPRLVFVPQVGTHGPCKTHQALHCSQQWPNQPTTESVLQSSNTPEVRRILASSYTQSYGTRAPVVSSYRQYSESFQMRNYWRGKKMCCC